MEYLLIWILFACAAYAVANSRGRNKFLWFVIALFIGPFAVLIVALIPLGKDPEQGYK